MTHCQRDTVTSYDALHFNDMMGFAVSTGDINITVSGKYYCYKKLPNNSSATAKQNDFIPLSALHVERTINSIAQLLRATEKCRFSINIQ
jgi:hypothetical protein